MSADVADADCVEKAAARIENEFGPIEAWVRFRADRTARAAEWRLSRPAHLAL